MNNLHYSCNGETQFCISLVSVIVPQGLLQSSVLHIMNPLSPVAIKQMARNPLKFTNMLVIHSWNESVCPFREREGTIIFTVNMLCGFIK